MLEQSILFTVFLIFFGDAEPLVFDQKCDFTGLDEADQEIEKLKVIQAEACTPFDLEKGPLFRTVLQQTSANTHHLTITAHHIVLDGWSLGVMLNDLGSFYSARSSNREPDLSPLPIQYADYSVWQEKRLLQKLGERQLDYWKRQLSEALCRSLFGGIGWR